MQPVLAAYALAGGLISFIGWYADIPRLTDWPRSGISIQPNTTIAVMCAATALLFLRLGYRRPAAVFGALTAAIGTATLLEYLPNIDLGIDRLFLFGRTWGNVGVISPGRMGPPGSVSWTLLGFALVFASYPPHRRLPRAIATGLALVAMSIAMFSLVGYLYGVAVFYTLPTLSIIALQTSTFILSVSLGVVLSIPDLGPMRLLNDDSAAGALARRLLPAVVIVPIVLGLLRMEGEQADLFDLPFGTAARTLAELVLMLSFLWWSLYAIAKQTSARRAAEERLVESLREADRRKNEFIATLAHELRNPLAPVRNAVTVIKLKSQPDSVLTRASDVIERQVVLMARLLDDLLDIGRITSDKLELRTQRVELGAVVRDAIDMCKPMIEEYEHELTVVLCPTAIHVDADPARLGQIFGNLVNNACKYTETRGRIGIIVSREDDSGVVTVTDTGGGIPPDKLSSIFDMFSQVDRALNRPQGGLGIGLHLVKRLVEMHGGSVSAHSDGPGLGSRFVVRLPALADTSEREADDRPPLPTHERPVAARRILVVDDNVDHAESLAHLLSFDGHDVQMAHDGLEGLMAAERMRPEIVLMDLGLPVLDGFDACRRIREQPWGKQMLMIAITGWGQEADRRKSSEAGFDHHLVKPVDARAIAALLTGVPASSSSA